MFIPDPDFYPSRISDLESRIKKQERKRGVKKIVVIPFFVALNFTKLLITYIMFEMLKKETNLGQFQRIIELFTQKIVTKLSKYGFGVGDPGSEIRTQGVKKAPEPGSGSATLINVYQYRKGRVFGTGTGTTWFHIALFKT
jgi:hypothetical protein